MKSFRTLAFAVVLSAMLSGCYYHSKTTWSGYSSSDLKVVTNLTQTGDITSDLKGLGNGKRVGS